MPASTCPARPLVEDHRGERGGEDRRAAVEQAGDRTRHVLLGDREQGERDRHPHHREQHDAARGRSDRTPPAAGGRGPTRDRAESDPQQRDRPGRHRVEADVDEQERRAPDATDRHEQRPVVRREALVHRREVTEPDPRDGRRGFRVGAVHRNPTECLGNCVGRLFVMATFRDLLAAAKSEIVEVDTDDAAARIADGAARARRA